MNIFIDTETTGLDAKTCRIIELAAYTDKEQIDYLIRLPEEEKLPEFITNLTGLTDNDLEKEGVSEEEALEAFFNIFPEDETVCLVAHNCQFDASFIREAVLKHPEHPEWLKKFDSADLLDTKTIYQTRYEEERHRLSDAIERYGLQDECKNSHRAIDDAYALKRVFEEMQKEKDNFSDFINVFAIHPKYGLSGDKLAKVTYGLVENGKVRVA